MRIFLSLQLQRVASVMQRCRPQHGVWHPRRWGEHRVSVEESRSGVVFAKSQAPSSNNAIRAIRRSLIERDPGDRDAA
jgi:hypothetical protein